MWTHLELAGVFSRVRGIALGSFTGCEEKDASYTSDEVLGDLARATGLPSAAGFPVGTATVTTPSPPAARVRPAPDRPPPPSPAPPRPPPPPAAPPPPPKPRRAPTD